MTPARGFAASADAVAHAFVAVLSDRVQVHGDDGHHLQRVRRLRAGEHMTLADGSGRWRRYEITAAARGSIVVDARGDVEVEPDLTPRVAVALALTKGGFDTVAARLTEIGVHRIEPLAAQRCVVRWEPVRAKAAVDRLRAVVREAAAQSRRARVPEIADLVSVAALAGRRDVVLADRDGVPVSELPEPATGEWTVVIGPEGGLAPEERALFDAPRLAVGPYVLRAETAPIAASAALIGRARWSVPE